MGPMTSGGPQMKELMDKTKTGLYRKFDVRRTDGSDAPNRKHDGCSYFVLDLTHDQHAIPALRAYAKSCRVEYPVLAQDLESLADGNPLMPALTHLAIGEAPSSAAMNEVIDMGEHIIEIDEDGKVHGNDLEHAIASVLNCFSAENPSNTPDWILAQYLLGCLAAWNTGVQQRETWYGRDARPTAAQSDDRH